MATRWQIAPRTHDDLLEQILVNRGVAVNDFATFRSPSWERDIHDASIFQSINLAVERLFFALEKGESIVIHGDYDADGVSGTTLLYGVFNELVGAFGWQPNIRAFLPDREKDGYGVAMHNVERFAAENVTLLVTVDCGIANGLELNRAKELGVDTIVCDHHQMGDHYPSEAIILHPLAPGETYPNKVLCGTGVAFKFACALIAEARRRGGNFVEGYEKWLLDLVAIATVTDVMPLIGENRALEHFGLKVLKKTRRPGLKALIAMTGTELDALDTQAIGFRIGPRLNAAGRLASAELAFRTLAARTDDDARQGAVELERLNRERQNVFASTYEEAYKMGKEQAAKSLVIAVYAPHWLPGIVGLLAGRLVTDFGLPAFAFTRVGDHVVGSGRSVGGLHLTQGMMSCDDKIFIKRGGHPQACGLSLHDEKSIDIFRDQMNEFARKHFGDAGVVVDLHLDAILPLHEATLDIVDSLKSLAPFGEGNRPPIFGLQNVTVTDASIMGATGQHLRLSVDDGGTKARIIGFGFSSRAAECRVGQKIDVAFELQENEFQGRREAQLRLVDLRPAGGDTILGAPAAFGVAGETGAI